MRKRYVDLKLVERMAFKAGEKGQERFPGWSNHAEFKVRMAYANGYASGAAHHKKIRLIRSHGKTRSTGVVSLKASLGDHIAFRNHG